MPKKFKRMSRQHQQFIYVALINNYASYLQSKDKNPVSMQDNVYWTAKAKHELKKLFIKATKDIREEKPLVLFNQMIGSTRSSIDSFIEIHEDNFLRKFIFIPHDCGV